jgi:DnaJ-class molecular chaperone
MADGDVVKFDQIADEAAGHIPGDLIFRLKQVPHPFFSREGDNLRMNMDIKLIDSLVGFTRIFQHVDGHDVTVVKNSVSYCAEVVIVKGEGMPLKRNKNIRGDLLITISIDFPGSFSEQQKGLIKQAFAAA